MLLFYFIDLDDGCFDDVFKQFWMDTDPSDKMLCKVWINRDPCRCVANAQGEKEACCHSCAEKADRKSKGLRERTDYTLTQG